MTDTMTNAILLSFDIEEFDIPEEYGQTVPEAVKFAVSRQGLAAVLAILDELDVVATFFVTAHFADHHPEIIQQISQRHEIGLNLPIWPDRNNVSKALPKSPCRDFGWRGCSRSMKARSPMLDMLTIPR
jgi:hypothetical protein